MLVLTGNRQVWLCYLRTIQLRNALVNVLHMSAYRAVLWVHERGGLSVNPSEGVNPRPDATRSKTCATLQDVTEVVNTCHEAGISKLAVKLRPIAVIKG